MPDKKYSYCRKTKRYNGKKYEGTGKTELDALTDLAQKLAAAQRGEEELGGGMTVDAWFEKWFSTYIKPRKMTEKSKGMYREKYNGYIKPRIGTMRLKDVKDVHLQQILNSEVGKSKSHMEKLRLVLKKMFYRARKSRLIAYDPAEDLELMDCNEGHRRSITDVEREVVLRVAETTPSGLWVLTLLYAGLRPAETVPLRWSDVDFDANEIHVHAAKESGATFRIKSTKNGDPRIVPIHALLRPKLRAAAQGKTPDDFVFTTRTGHQLYDAAMTRLWRSFKRAMDIDMGAPMQRNRILKSLVASDLTPYCFRHTFCTDLERQGVPINVAKELMGHRDVAMTANIYTHKDTQTLHGGMERLDGTQAARERAEFERRVAEAAKRA